MRQPWTVLKVGGSVLENGALPSFLAGIGAETRKPLVIVPGGGPFADAVRVAQDRAGFADELAHRLALDAMGRMAVVFAAIEPRLRVVCHSDEFASVVAAGQIPVWDPVASTAGNPAIPASWAVTSDSLALWLATTIGAERVIIVKSVDAPAALSADELAARGIVDAAFPRFARHFDGAIEVLGPGRWPIVPPLGSAAA